MKTTYSRLVSALLLFGLIGCGSQVVSEKFPAGTSPDEAISIVEERKEKALAEHADALAHRDYRKGEEALEDAREELRDDEREDALEEAAKARAYFEKAVGLADQRRALVDEVLVARDAALSAGVDGHGDLRERKQSIDEDLRDETDDFEVALSTKSFKNLQRRYLDLEVDATQRKELSMVKERIDSAISRDGWDLAPNTLRMAEKHHSAAENLIATNVRYPSEYENSVVEAKESSLLLEEVMAKFDKLGEDINEQAALELVYQDRRIQSQSQRIGSLQGDVQQYATGMGLLGQEMSSQRSRLMSAQSQIEFQRAMERAASELSESDAEVYQQGDKLIIRLKKMNFATGSAEIPGTSTDLLQRVNGIIGELDPAAIVVQGHTDSTGSDELNQQLSHQRAQAVKDYFAQHNVENTLLSAKGMGENAPLASNDSDDGRAQNRRVDIVIQAKSPETYSE